ncbi:UNVERIFIED_CONTAM: hypothetical protein Sindi_0937200 [Sesamum indicum]
MTISASQPLGCACDSCLPWDEPADAPSAAQSSKGVSQPPTILTDSHTTGSNSTMGASSTQVPVRPLDAPPHHHQRHYFPQWPRGVSSAPGMQGSTAIFTRLSILRSKGIICIPGLTYRRSTN